MKSIFSFILLLFSIHQLSAENNGFNIRDFNNENGLAHNFIYDVTQSPLGYMLISTEQGVYKYNGASFEKFDNRILQHDIITSICNTPKGFYYGTLNGTIFFPDTTFTIVSGRVDYIALLNNQLYLIDSFREIKRLSIDLKNPETIFTGANITSMCVFEEELYFIDNGLFCKYNLENKNVTIIEPNNTFAHMTCNRTSISLCDNNNGLFEYTKNKLVKYYQLDHHLEISTLRKSSINDVWIGTKASGLICLANDQQGYEKITYSNVFKESSINIIYEDDEDNIWVGTQGRGLLQMIPTVFPFKKTPFKISDAITVGDSSLLAVGENYYQQFPIYKNGLLGNCSDTVSHSIRFNSICEFNGKLLYGTYDGLYELNYNNPEASIQIRPGFVTKVAALSENTLAICLMNEGLLITDTSYNKLAQYNLMSGLPGNNVETVFQDSKGTIWFYVTNNGLVKISKGKIELLSHNDKFPNVRITDIKEDKDNNIWFATDGKGLLIQNNASDSIRSVTIEEGLLSNFPNSVSFNKSDVWVFFKEGIQKINSLNHIVNYHSIDHTITSYSKHAIQSSKGVFAMSKTGIKQVNFEMDSVEHKLRTPYFEDISLNNVTVCKKDTVCLFENALAHDQNNFTIDFISVFLKYNKQYFRYKLKGLEDKWNHTSKEPSINYSNLSHGKYTFVIHSSKDQYFDAYKEAHFSFTINKPFWDEWWFYLIQILILGLLAFLLYKLSKGTNNGRIIRFSSYIAIFLIFDFIHELVEPYFIESAQNITIIKIGLNLLIALLLYPLELLLQKNFFRASRK